MSERILKDIASDNEAQDKLMSGIDKVANVVASTFGYRGRTVLIESDYGLPEPTKDGFKTLQSIFLEDPIENIACQIAKEASQKTVDFAGDGTSSTLILLQAILKNSIDAVRNGKSPIDVKNEIEKSRDLVVKYLDEISIPITDKLIYDIALTSANGEEEIAKIVSDAYIKAGENGSVTHFRSNTDDTFLEFIEGTLVESGYSDERFINVFSERTCEFSNNPLVVCSAIEFKTVRQVLPFMTFAHENQRELVIISEMTPQVKDVILQNVIQKGVPFAVVNAPNFGKKRIDYLNDLAVLLGTQCITTLSGDDFEGRELAFLGQCEKIVIGKNDTIVTPIKDEAIQEVVNGKIAEIKSVIETTKNNTEKKYLKERIAKLNGGVAIIKVGSIIESELQEKIDRVDDAVCAVRSAKEEGVVAGGGVALNNARIKLKKIICEEIFYSLRAPISRLLENAGKDYADISEKIHDYPIGYDVKDFKEIDMFEAGIVDSTKAIKHAFINAVSASNTILLTNNIITNKRAI